MDANFEGPQCRLASPHSSAIVDLNRDLLGGMSIIPVLYAMQHKPIRMNLMYPTLFACIDIWTMLMDHLLFSVFFSEQNLKR